jgi:drug/metabolite transporter (DMT)-like permease
LELWIPLTLLAAFSQNIRSALQKRLTEHLSVLGATQARFLFAVPFAALYLYLLVRFGNYVLPRPNIDFFIYVTLGGVAQILGTALLVGLFSYKNFVVGTTYSKTEAIQTAILGLIILGDKLSAGGIVGICIGLVGVLMISGGRGQYTPVKLLQSLVSRAALMGILSGLCFGISAICVRGASLSLSGGYLVQAGYTLLCMQVLQTIMVAAYLWVRDPQQNRAVVRHWRVSWLVGLAGMIASLGWFTAMTLQNAGYVRALGQIELVFAFLASAIFFREKTTRLELLGIFVVVVGILILVLFR